MVREILFRGQTRRYGERVYLNGDKVPSHWVYGGIFQGSGDFSVIYGAGNDEFDTTSIQKYTVYSDTVGQYTGIQDKNGKRIFDGDIISIPFVEDRSPYEENCISYENGLVYFCDEHHGWYVKFFDDALSLWEYDDSDIEVVGNVYDSFELLGFEMEQSTREGDDE